MFLLAAHSSCSLKIMATSSSNLYNNFNLEHKTRRTLLSYWHVKRDCASLASATELFNYYCLFSSVRVHAACVQNCNRKLRPKGKTKNKNECNHELIGGAFKHYCHHVQVQSPNFTLKNELASLAMDFVVLLKEEEEQGTTDRITGKIRQCSCSLVCDTCQPPTPCTMTRYCCHIIALFFNLP